MSILRQLSDLHNRKYSLAFGPAPSLTTSLFRRTRERRRIGDLVLLVLGQPAQRPHQHRRNNQIARRCSSRAAARWLRPMLARAVRSCLGVIAAYPTGQPELLGRNARSYCYGLVFKAPPEGS